MTGENTGAVVSRVPPSWDETFMRLARVYADRSKDPGTQVGAVIAGADRRQLSAGYNGEPRGYTGYDDMPWARESERGELYTKYPYVVHAEENAVLNYRGVMRDMEGAAVYVTHYPCNKCARILAQVGIKRVVYEHVWDDGLRPAADDIFAHAGISVEQYQGVSVALPG